MYFAAASRPQQYVYSNAPGYLKRHYIFDIIAAFFIFQTIFPETSSYLICFGGSRSHTCKVVLQFSSINMSSSSSKVYKLVVSLMNSHHFPFA